MIPIGDEIPAGGAITCFGPYGIYVFEGIHSACLLIMVQLEIFKTIID